MQGEGWKKELTFKYVLLKQGAIHVQEWDFFADQMTCSIRSGGNSGPKCGADHTFVTVFNGKVFWCCFTHRISNGPISLESGHKANEYPVSASEAMVVMKETGQAPEKELFDMFLSERTAKTGRARRPKK